MSFSSTKTKQDDEFCFIYENSSDEEISTTPIDNKLISTNPFEVMFQKQTFSLCIDVGFKNLSWCVLENPKNSLNKIIHEHGVCSIYSKKTNVKIDWEEVNDKLYILFQENVPLLEKYQNELNGIFIERQPNRNTNNCILAGTLFTFFYNQMKLIQRDNFWFSIPIEYMDSRKKLSVYTLISPEISSLTIPKSSYYQRKKEAVRRVLKLLENECIVYRDDFFLENNEFNTKFSFEMHGGKKKDDLADSLLMCYFISSKG